MQDVSSKSDFNPDYIESMCVSIKLHPLGFVFIALDNSVVHMCLYAVVDQIMLLPSNQMEWILMYYESLVLFYGTYVSAEQSLLVFWVFFFFAPRCMDLKPQHFPLPRFCESGILCVSVCDCWSVSLYNYLGFFGLASCRNFGTSY